MKTFSANTTTLTDSMRSAPIRLVVMEFSTTTLRLCSGMFGDAGERCVFDSNLYEPIMVGFGNVRGDSLNPADYSRTPSDAELVIDNTVPIGGYDSFTALFGAEASAYTPVSIYRIFENAMDAGDEITEFAGKIESISSMTTESVVVRCSGIDLATLTSFPASYVALEIYPNASEDDVGKLLPVVYGQALRVPMRCLNTTTFVYAISHPVNAIDAVYIDGVVQSSGFTKYTGQSGHELSGYSNMAVVDFTGDPGGIVSADIDGYQDDGSGTHTGTPDSLIERPDYILRHLLITLCGLPAGNIDDTSYNASGTGYETAVYVEAVVIVETPSLTTLINQIAYQAQSLEFWEAGKHHLVFIGGSSGSEEEVSGSVGIFAGGSLLSGWSDVIQKITISTTGNAEDFGDLTQARFQLSGTSNGSGDRCIFGAGYDFDSGLGGNVNTIDYITASTPGNALDFGDRTIARRLPGATSNGTTGRGVFAGGAGPNTNIIDYVTIGTTSNASDFGDLSTARGYLSANSNATGDRGVFGGGYNISGDGENVIEYVTISTTGNATDVGDLTATKAYLASTSNGTSGRGVFAGGRTVSGSVRTDVIEYITIGTPGNATDFGDLSSQKSGLTSVSNGTSGRGVFAGGNTAVAGWIDVIEYITIGTLGNATDFGDLLEGNTGPGGASNA